MDGLFSFVSSMGLGTAWLPILVALLGVPTQYVLLGMSAHQEFRSVVGKVFESEGISSVRKRDELVHEITSSLRIFELDWWIVGAFGILITTIIASGYLSEWAVIAPAEPVLTPSAYRCIGEAVDRLSCVPVAASPSSSVKAAMSLYATMVSLLIGFRLGWARLQLARELSRYYLVPEFIRQRTGKDGTMPPSGYSSHQADCVRDFLRSCAGALLSEAHSKKISLVSALESELRNIDFHLQSQTASTAQKATLEMTMAFYDRVRALAPGDEKTFDTTVRAVSNEIHNEIVSVKVIEQALA